MLALALSLALASSALAQTAGSIQQVGSTEVSAMMMFVGNEQKVYIMDKVENNAAQIDQHPAWAVEWDIATNKPTLMPMTTNVFCAAGMHFPNGSWATFGGNMAVGPNCPPVPQECTSDSVYGDWDGATAVRILTPCDNSDDGCEWLDNGNLNLLKRRWYAAVEALGDGTHVIIGGFVNGGYINRNWPNTDPFTEGGAAEPTYEFWPSTGDAQVMQFMGKTSGLNSYAHTFLMPDGRLLVQANLSTILFDAHNNQETDLPDMPGNIPRVYPASGAVAMLPLTPDNNYNPTILFCGGIDIPDEEWGNYVLPFAKTWEINTSADCQRLTPLPADNSTAQYQQDDDMLDGRSMGQFIILPDETLLVVNGAAKGTAGYAGNYTYSPFGESLATDPVFKPALYDPSKPAGQRWSDTGFQASTIPRLYHSSAILLPDTSVMIAGSNPNVDVNTTAPYPTTYIAERFYPSYFNASTRPSPSGVPKNLTYGGSPFDITIPPSGFTGNANTAAANTRIVVIRPGFSTHAMNMGQRALRLNSSYSVADDGTITMHVSQMPANANLFQPGPAFLYTVVNGIPSNGTMVIIGSGNIETQPTLQVADLPASTNSSKIASSENSTSSSPSGKSSASSIQVPMGSVMALGLSVLSLPLLALLA